MKRYFSKLLGALAFCICLLNLFSCTKDISDASFYDENEVTILAYLEERKEFSEFVKLIYQANLNGMLGAYGSYTVFAFTNEALDVYKQENSISEFTDDEATRLVEYHILSGISSTETMGNGGLPQTTIAGDYIEASLSSKNEIILNRSAKIIKRDIELTNGRIHLLDKTMKPINEGIKELIWKNESFSLFKALWELSGFDDIYESLQVGSAKTPITIFLVPDSVYQRNGLNTVDDILALPCIQHDNTRLLDFVSYHIISGMNFLNNFEGGNYSTYGTEMISVKVEDVYKVNKTDNDGVETYIPIYTQLSNRQSINGVFHVLGNVLIPMTPKAEYTFFDFWDQPEITNRIEYKSKSITGIQNWEFSRMKVLVTGGTLDYFVSSHVPDQLNFVNRDQFSITGTWTVDFQTYKIAAGKYRMRLAYKNASTRAIVQIYLDGEKVGEPINMKLTSSSATDKDIVKEGVYFRTYIKDVEFKTTQEHSIRVATVVAGHGNMDGIEFEPIN